MSEAHKKAEFVRINTPRIERAVAQLRHIEKSAKSIRVHELDVAELFVPVVEAILDIVDEDAAREVSASGKLSTPDSLTCPAEPIPGLKKDDPHPPMRPPASADWMDGPGTGPEPTPAVSRAGVPYEDLPTTQLIDKMVAIGAIVATRRS